MEAVAGAVTDRRLARRGAVRPLAAWQQGLVWLWAAVCVAAIYGEGQHAQLDRHVTNRLRFHAIPVAISVLYHGAPHDYTAFESVAFPFQDVTADIDERIARAVKRPPPAGDPTYYWAADDRGMGDYVIGAFALFGPRAESLYLFYFVVLGASVMLFLADLAWHPLAAALLVFALAAIYTCTRVIPLGNLTLAIFEPGSLYEPRVVELLSYVATLHLALAPFVSDRWSAARRAIVAGQAAVLLACFHARSTVAWELVFVAAAGAACVLWRSVRRGDQAGPPADRVVLTAAWPLLCVVLGIGLLKAYQHVTYHPRYFQDMGARTVWHNALMGLWVNDHLAGKYQLRVNDRVVIAAVRNFLRESHDPRLTPEWTDSAVLGALGGHSTFNWFIYEKTAKDLYWHIWRGDTRDMLHCYLIDKPREIVDVLVAASSPDPRFTREIPGLGFRPLAPAPLLLALPGLLLVAAGNAGLTTVTVATLFLFACSLAPGVLFYPVVHTMIGSFATISLAVYVALAQAASIAIRWVWR